MVTYKSQSTIVSSTNSGFFILMFNFKKGYFVHRKLALYTGEAPCVWLYFLKYSVLQQTQLFQLVWRRPTKCTWCDIQVRCQWVELTSWMTRVSGQSTLSLQTRESTSATRRTTSAQSLPEPLSLSMVGSPLIFSIFG